MTPILSIPLAAQGLRQKPRFSLDPNSDFHVRIGEEVPRIVDVSAGGISLFSENSVLEGGEVSLTVVKAMRIYSQVVYCTPLQQAANGGPSLHKIGLKFLSENDGYRVAMLAMDTKANRDGSPMV